MDKVTNSDYLMITAMLAARETRALNADRMERMLAAPTDDEAAKIPEECGFGDLSGMNAQEIDRALEAYAAGVFTELQNIVPEKALVQMFRLKYDYHNAKTILKAQAAGTDGSALLSNRGTTPAQALADAFVSEDYRAVPPPLAEAMQEATGILARTENPQLADFALDQAYFAQLLAMAGTLNDEGFALGYVRLLIDCANLRSVVRTFRMKKDTGFLRLALVPDGTVSVPSLASAYDTGDGVGDALQALYGAKLAAAAEAGAAALRGGSLTKFERLCDNALIDYVRDAKLCTFGAAHVCAYLASVENEITAARMILTGRLSGLAPEVIRERLRESYA